MLKEFVSTRWGYLSGVHGVLRMLLPALPRRKVVAYAARLLTSPCPVLAPERVSVPADRETGSPWVQSTIGDGEGSLSAWSQRGRKALWNVLPSE